MHGMDTRVRRRLPDAYKALPLIRNVEGLKFDEEGLQGDEISNVSARRRGGVRARAHPAYRPGWPRGAMRPRSSCCHRRCCLFCRRHSSPHTPLPRLRAGQKAQAHRPARARHRGRGRL
jgi:hypothetical protein